MKVLITGGAGFIGSSVSDKLLELGHYVILIDNYLTGKPQNNQVHPNLNITECSVSDEDKMRKIFTESLPDIVIHAAASYKDPDNWMDDITNNICGTVNVIKCCKLTQVKKIIYLQTSLCYGLAPLHTPITLGHPLFSGGFKGGSSYAISKTTAEQYLELSGQKFISLRLANVYGPRNLSGPLPTFFYNLTNNLQCTIVNTKRDFIYINDVVNLITKTISVDNTGEYYNVSTGKDYSIKQLFDISVKHINISNIKKYIEKKMGIDEVSTILLDPSKTNADFNWLAETELEEGVKQTVAWYKKNTLSKTYTHLKNIN